MLVIPVIVFGISGDCNRSLDPLFSLIAAKHFSSSRNSPSNGFFSKLPVTDTSFLVNAALLVVAEFVTDAVAGSAATSCDTVVAAVAVAVAAATVVAAVAVAVAAAAATVVARGERRKC